MCISLQVQAVISYIVCIIWWCRLWLYPQQHVEEDSGCNDPNCLRCHSSTSKQHIQNFRTNVMLLHRLIKLEPQLFVGMRLEILSVAEAKMMQQDKKKHIIAENGHQRWLDNKIQQLLWNLISALSLDKIILALRGGERSTGSSIDTMTKMTTKSTTMQSLRQPGQNPTVFYLPGLESTPVHHNNDDDGNAHCSTVTCSCLRLWKKFEENTDNTDRSRSSKQPVGKFKIYPRMGGDIQALTNCYDIIKRELLEYLRLHSSCDTNNRNISSSSPFQPFDSKVYTHASDSTSHNRSSQHNSVSNDYSNQHQQEEEEQQQQQPEWSSVYLYHRGVIQSDTCQTYFPLTTNALQTQCTHTMAGSCGLGSVYFSKLGSNTKIKEHCGPTNARWRCHLPLIVPSSSVLEDDRYCATNVDDRQRRRRQSCLRVGKVGINEEYVYWKEGVPILFDDSFLHSAVHYHDVNHDDDTTDAGYDENAGTSSSKSRKNNKNSSNCNNFMNGARIVLIVDFWHPSLTQSDRIAFGVLYPPGS